MPFLIAMALTCAALSATRRDDGALEARAPAWHTHAAEFCTAAPAGCSAGAAPWRRCWRFPAPRRNAARAAAARWARRAGLALNIPGTSVQISRRAAASLAAKYAPEVSEPPRPRSTVSPSSFAAMNPWVMMTPIERAPAPAALGSGAKSQVADNRLAFSVAPGALGAQHLARIAQARRFPARSRNSRPGRREQLAHCHHARAQRIAHLAPLASSADAVSS
jgi:hypothetical protein